LVDFLLKIINSQAILYLARLHTDNLNPLLKEAFELSKSLDSQDKGEMVHATIS
jgi:hypothetical protein